MTYLVVPSEAVALGQLSDAADEYATLESALAAARREAKHGEQIVYCLREVCRIGARRAVHRDESAGYVCADDDREVPL